MYLCSTKNGNLMKQFFYVFKYVLLDFLFGG